MSVAVVAGALANKPGNGGEAWVRMSWARGLARLGFDVWFVESIPDPGGSSGQLERSAPVRFFRDVTAANGFTARRALWAGDRSLDLTRAEWEDLADACDLLVNISGHWRPDPWFDRIPLTVYVDLDPGYTQIWAERGLLGDQIERHDAHYTVGLAVGTPACDLPVDGVDWRPILQPVVLDDWPPRGPVAAEVAPEPVSPSGPLRFTTVASWRGAFGPIEHDGCAHGVKAHEWRRFRELPRVAAPHRFEAALAIHEADRADRERLERAGWVLEDPVERAGSPDRFRAYVSGSDAEFSVAQGIYVGAGTGWVSDRTARYLAAGRPAIVQDTGFGDHLPAGEGVLAFDTPRDAARSVDAVARDYAAHARAARALAETRFDSDVVLGGLLEELGVCP